MDVTDPVVVLAVFSAPGAPDGSGMSTLQLVMLVAAVGGLTILMIGTRRRLRDAQRSKRSFVREQYSELQREHVARRDLDHVMLELDQLARQIHGRLDTKLTRLEVVLQDADERIDRLTRLVRAADRDETVDVTLERAEPQDLPSPDTEPGPHGAIHRLADSGLSPMQIARETDKTVGEIELILALRKAKERAESPPPPIHAAGPAPRG